MDRIQAMQLFVRIAESGSFTRAAQELGISRPLASTTIQQLEERLGTRLLNRTTRRTKLTPDGVAYHLRCLRLLTDVEEADSMFQQAGASLRGKLRVDVPSRIARLVIVPELPSLLKHHPALELELGCTDRPIDLLQDGVDCVVRVGSIVDERLVRRELAPLPMGSYASPAYLERHGVPQRVEDLCNHFAVNYSIPLGRDCAELEFAANGNRQTISIRQTITVNNVETYIACALAGFGLIQIPVYDAARHVAAGELVPVLTDLPPPPMSLSIIYPRNRHPSRRLQAFIDWTRQVLERRLLAETSSGRENGFLEDEPPGDARER